VVVNDIAITNVGVRKKGFLGSLSTTRPSLKIKFSEFGNDKRLFGLERMTLNNGNQDPSRIKTCLAYKIFTDAGVKAPRCNFAHVRVTHEGGTEDLGIFAHVESIKSAFLQRAFGSADGNLYEPAARADLRPGEVAFYEIKNNEDENDTTDLWRLVDELDRIPGADFVTKVGQHVHVDDFLTFWTTEALVGHWDGYAGDRNNNYMYADPADGLFRFIPWGTDDTFGQGNPFTGEGPVAPLIWTHGHLARQLYSQPSMASSYQQRMQELFDTVWDETEILVEIDRMEALITPVTGDISSRTDAIATFVLTREAKFLADFAGGPPTQTGSLGPRPCFDGPLFTDITPCPSCSFFDTKRKCQEAIARAGLDLIKQRMRSVQRCRKALNDGTALFHADGATPLFDPADCGDEERASRTLSKAVDKARTRLSRSCTDFLVGELASCGETVDGLVGPGGDTGCLLDSHVDGADDMIDDQYGSAVVMDEGARKCQAAIAKAGLKYATKTLKTVQKCRNRINKGLQLFLDADKTLALASSADCANEFKSATKIAKDGKKARALIERDFCSSATLMTLDACAATIDEVVDVSGTSGCLIETHDGERLQALRKQYCDELICP
jgi:hypothetical protein